MRATTEGVQQLPHRQTGKGQRVRLCPHAVTRQAVAIGPERSGRQDGRLEGNTLKVGRRQNRRSQVAWRLPQHVGLWCLQGQGQTRRNVGNKLIHSSCMAFKGWPRPAVRAAPTTMISLTLHTRIVTCSPAYSDVYCVCLTSPEKGKVVHEEIMKTT